MIAQFINPRRLCVVRPIVASVPTIIDVPSTFPVSNLIDESVLAHVASIFAPVIEDDTWLLAMPAPRASERWYDWIV